MLQNGALGRQPILLADGTTYGYELLYREDETLNSANVTDDNQATSRVLVSALNNFGIDKLVGESKAFINVSKELLLDPILEVIPKEKFILEILEDVVVDEILIERIKYLKSQGYMIAIDDLNFEENMVENFEPLFVHCDILKIDLMQTGIKELKQKLEYFKKFDLKLLAEKVETLEEFHTCRENGFEYFQGYFFSKPDILCQKKLDPSSAMVIHIITLLNSDKEIKEIEQEFLKAPELVINLLKYLNSASFGMRSEIKSIAHAMSLLGKVQLSRWLTLYLYSGAGENIFSLPLMESAVFRAKFMSEIALSMQEDKHFQEKAYLTGMLSLIDVVLHTNFQEIFEEMRFEEDIQSAILQNSGKLGAMLLLSKKVERLNEEFVFSDIQMSVDKKKFNIILTHCHEYVSTLRTTTK